MSTNGRRSDAVSARRQRERTALAELRLAELKAGTRLVGGVVRGIQPYGAFVDVGLGRDGLLPKTEQLAAPLEVGQRLEAVYVSHVNLERGRLTLSLSPAPRGVPRRSPRPSHASGSGGQVEGGSVRSCGNGSRTTASASTGALKAATIEALAAALELAPEGLHLDGVVVGLTGFGAFVRLGGAQLAAIVSACHEDGRISIGPPPRGVSVDGLLHTSELAAAFRAGIIGPVGSDGEIAVGALVAVRVMEVSAERQQLRLSLCPARAAAPPRAAHDRIEETHAAHGELEEAGGPREVDGETLAARLRWEPPVSEDEQPAVRLATRTLRRCPRGRFRTIGLVELPWKDLKPCTTHASGPPLG